MPEIAADVLLYSHPIQYKDLAYTQKQQPAGIHDLQHILPRNYVWQIRTECVELPQLTEESKKRKRRIGAKKNGRDGEIRTLGLQTPSLTR